MASGSYSPMGYKQTAKAEGQIFVEKRQQKLLQYEKLLSMKKRAFKVHFKIK